MENHSIRLYSALFRLLITVVIIAFPLINGSYSKATSTLQNAFFIFLILLLISTNIVFHIFDPVRISSMILSFIAAVILYFNFDKIVILLIVLNILDLLANFRINTLFGLLLLVILPYSRQYYFDFTIFTILITFLYYLVYSVVKEQSEYIEITFKKEKQLLNRLVESDKKHKYKLDSTVLQYENQRLQEKSELSQNLHDKIGHVINGSVFKFEGARLLTEKDPAKSAEMIGDVIMALRDSVDEIRLLLRDEKPSPELMNIGKLRALLSDFTNKYDIRTNLEVEVDIGRVPLSLYLILFDNTIEALSNSLKYSRCSEISVSLRIYNRIIRYSVSDNGVGTQNIVENMGFSSIRERTQLAGGNVSISGTEGFEINMLIPIADTDQGV